jgi:lysophospholipase L1-like esterase
MSEWREAIAGLLWRRLVWLTFALALVVFLALLGCFWIHDHVPRWVYWQAGLIGLLVIEGAYWLTVALAIPSALVLSVLVISRRVQGTQGRTVWGRWLLLSISLGAAIVAAEGVCAVWRDRLQDSTALFAGGLKKTSEAGTTAAPPAHLRKEVNLPLDFPESKPAGEIELVVMGESSAEGVPYNFWLSIGEMVRWQLEEAISGLHVKFRLLAFSGQTLEAQHYELRKLERRPDIVIIYSGHNEFSARFESARRPIPYVDEEVPSAQAILIERIEERSAVCALIQLAAAKCKIAMPPPRHGYRALVDAPVYTPVEYEILLADFRRRLDAIVGYTKQVGAIPILIVPAANDAGLEPSRSFLPARTPRAERAAFQREFMAARQGEERDPLGSLKRYRAIVDSQPGFAEAHYRMGKLLEQSGEYDAAYEHYVRARDLDGFPLRLPSAFQDVYRKVAARHVCILIDTQAYFHRIGRHGLLDDELFHDGMHPSLRGQIALSQAVLQALHARRAFGWAKDARVLPIDPARVVAHYHLTPLTWRRICLWGILFYDSAYPLRYDPSHRIRMKEAFANAANEIEAGVAPESVGMPNIGMPRPVPIVPDLGRPPGGRPT